MRQKKKWLQPVPKVFGGQFPNLQNTYKKRPLPVLSILPSVTLPVLCRKEWWTHNLGRILSSSLTLRLIPDFLACCEYQIYFKILTIVFLHCNLFSAHLKLWYFCVTLGQRSLRKEHRHQCSNPVVQNSFFQNAAEAVTRKPRFLICKSQTWEHQSLDWWCQNVFSLRVEFPICIDPVLSSEVRIHAKMKKHWKECNPRIRVFRELGLRWHRNGALVLLTSVLF